jgi:hypothetical protein
VAGFEDAVQSIAQHGLTEGNLHPTLLLGLGMMLAEFNRTEFADPDEEASLQKPPHVTATPLGLPHSDTVTGAVRLIW